MGFSRLLEKHINRLRNQHRLTECTQVQKPQPAVAAANVELSCTLKEANSSMLLPEEPSERSESDPGFCLMLDVL